MADAAEQVQVPGGIHAGVPNILVREGAERTGETRTRQPLPGVTDRERRRWRQIQHATDPVRARGAHPSPRRPNVQVAAQHLAHQAGQRGDRKSTRLNSSHSSISYAVFCLKKKKKKTTIRTRQRYVAD